MRGRTSWVVAGGLAAAVVVAMLAVLGAVNHAWAMYAKRPPVPLALPAGMSNVVERMAQHVRGFIGVVLGTDVRTGMPLVSMVYPNSPSQLAGLQPGDVIVRVDGRETRGLPLLEVSRMIRGQPNSEVILSIERPSKRVSLEVKVARVSQKRLFENLSRPRKVGP